MEEKFLIERLEIYDLWGYRDIELTFFPDVNILIGPNASGKTTILNLLQYILTLDLGSLAEMAFKSVVIQLKSFSGNHTKTIIVETTKQGFKYQISKKVFHVNLHDLPRSFVRQNYVTSFVNERRIASFIGDYFHDLHMEISSLVPAVWLPVSRRLPIIDEDEENEYDKRRVGRRESVDLRLTSLLGELVTYRLSLEGQLSEKYKEFERKVLQLILYSKDHDDFQTISKIQSRKTKISKEELIKAFEVVGLMDEQMKKRIEEHLIKSEEVIKLLNDRQRKTSTIGLNELFIMPLLSRTDTIITFSRELDKFREELFKPIRNYERILSDFLNGKAASVKDSGELIIQSENLNNNLGINKLSSGEKQIIILLTQALLLEDRPIVYVVDEPELSLHVTWQEKLLSSLLELGGSIQIIAATHSPDIVGPYRDKVLELNIGDVRI